MLSQKKYLSIIYLVLVILGLCLPLPLYAVDDIEDDSTPIVNGNSPFEIPQQIIPVLDNTTYLYYFESDDTLLSSNNRSKRYSFGTQPDEKVTLLVYGLDDLIVPHLALYNANGELIREGTSPLNQYVTGLQFEAGDKELFFFEVSAKNNATGVVRAMLFEGDPYDYDLTLLDTINPLLPGRAFLIAGDHIDAAIDGLNVRVEVLPVPRFDDERPQVFASRGTEAQYPVLEERITPDKQRGWANTSDVPVYTINVRAAPEPTTSVNQTIAYNKSLNLNTFFYFEYHLIIGKGSVPQLLLRGDTCQSNPNRPECIRSTGDNTGRSDGNVVVPTPNPAPVEVELLFPLLPTLIEPPNIPFEYIPPTVTIDCPQFPNPFDPGAINIINGNNTNESLGGTGCQDEINALGGDDSIDGGILSDTLNGGAGNDKFFDTADAFFGFFNDVFNGDTEIDTLEATYGAYSDSRCDVVVVVGFDYSVRCNNRNFSNQEVNYTGNGSGDLQAIADVVSVTDNYSFNCDPFFLAFYGICINVLQYAGTDIQFSTQSLETNTFTGIENITSGGTTNDTYTIALDATNNIFDGGAGNDTINYSGSANDVIFDVSGTTSVIQTNIAGVDYYDAPLNFENYQGSQGVDRLNINNTTSATGLLRPEFIVTNSDGTTFVPNVTTNLPTNYNTGAGNDIITVSNIGTQAVTINGGIGNDTFTVNVDANIDTFVGGGDIDTLEYNTVAPFLVDYNAAVNSEIRNNTTNALLDIFQDMDNITTTAANDVFSIEFDGGDNSFDANGGIDLADYTATGAATTFNLDALGSVTVTQGGGEQDTLLNFEGLIGTNQGDTFNITNAAFFTDANGDGVQGGAGNDTFNLLASDTLGASLFDGGADVDNFVVNFAATVSNTAGINEHIITGDGDIVRNFENITASDFLITPDNVNTTYNGAGANDTYTVNGNTGVTINIAAATTVVGGGGTDILQNIENIVGSGGDDIFNIDIEASGAAITLDGGAGNNTFVFNGDLMDIDNGIRTITINNVAGGTNWLSFNGLAGTTGLTINMNNTAYNQFGTFVINLDAVINRLIGTNQIDNITGTGGVDTIYGAGGNDTINGGAGNDNIGDSAAGGQNSNNAGDDTLYGGLGDDIIYAGGGSDTVYGGAICGGLIATNSQDGDDTIVGGTGTDTLYGGNNNSVGGNFNNCDDGTDSVTDLNNGDTDTLYGGNNNTGGGSGNDGDDTIVSVDETTDVTVDTAYAGNNNTGGGTGTDGGTDTAAGDPGDTLGNGNNP